MTRDTFKTRETQFTDEWHSEWALFEIWMKSLGRPMHFFHVWTQSTTSKILPKILHNFWKLQSSFKTWMKKVSIAAKYNSCIEERWKLVFLRLNCKYLLTPRSDSKSSILIFSESDFSFSKRNVEKQSGFPKF